MSISNAKILFTSGTGNSFRVSEWAAARINSAGIKCDISSCEKTKARDIHPEPGQLYGFVSPTHGFTLPWHMLKYMLRLPRGKGARAFCLATRGSLRAFGFNIPGISASLTFLTAMILIIKGWKVLGFDSINMPSNWYSLHPPQKRMNHEKIISQAEKRVIWFTGRLLSGRRVFLTWNNLYELFWAFTLSIVSIGYLFVGRFFLAKLFFANNNCDSCEACSVNCPIGAIKMDKGRPFWRYNCESCMRCAAVCPNHAVEAGHSLGVIFYFVASIPISAWLFSLPAGSVLSMNFSSSFVGQIINIVYFYPAIFFSYFVFNRLIRIKFINKFFTYTTFTHLWGRYFLPGLKKGILKKK